MKTILFPCTSRVHFARQKRLVDELRRHFVVDIFEPKTRHKDDLEAYTIFAAVELRNQIAGRKYAGALIRADRLELLPITSLLAYRKIPIVHIEGGADSGVGVIDTRIRNAITSLADIHLVTDESARRRVQGFGVDNVYNVGSLDVSFASEQVRHRPRRIIEDDYLLLLHHAVPGEDTETVLRAAKTAGLKIVGVKSNNDYGKSLWAEEWSPEEFVSLIHHAKCFVGNSSAICKESSVIGTPAVLTGHRQDGRVVGWNVLRAPHDRKDIALAIKWQLQHGRYRRDDVYFKPDTEKEVCKILKKHL